MKFMCLVGVVGIIGCFQCTDALAQGSDAKNELLELMSRYRDAWSEGHLEATTNGAFGPATIKAWWAGSQFRREYLYRGLKGTGSSSWEGHVVSNSRYCDYHLEGLSATCGPRAEFKGVLVFLRVLPRESWLELMYKKSMERWIESSPGATSVLKLRDGNFVAIFGPPAEAARYADRILRSEPIDDIRTERAVLIAKFNKYGLPLSTRYVGKMPKNQFRLECTWTDSDPPALETLTRSSTSDGGKTFDIQFKIHITKAAPRLPDDAPSLSIPPNDLPFGTRIADKTTGKNRITFVGGKQGESHHILHRSARRLRRAVSK